MMLVIVLHLTIRIWPSLYFHCFLYFTPFAIDMVDFFLRCYNTCLFWTFSWINVWLHGFRVWVWHFVLLLKFWRKKILPKLWACHSLFVYLLFEDWFMKFSFAEFFQASRAIILWSIFGSCWRYCALWKRTLFIPGLFRTMVSMLISYLCNFSLYLIWMTTTVIA